MKSKYSDVKGLDDITPTVGVDNAYDAMHLTALAIQGANSTEGEPIRQGYYKLDCYQGLINTSNKPFTATSHDALTPDDYVWA